MNRAYDDVLAASDESRAGLFDSTASRMGTTAQNVEKDFWVCWTLDALFNGTEPGGPRLLFKGGTSLSKGFGLINRFSEDIDVTVFRQDIGEPATVEELVALSRRQRQIRLEGIKRACQVYIVGPLLAELTALLAARIEATGLDRAKADVVPDDADPDGQTLLLWYPAATRPSAYVRAAVKIESGAKSALEPHSDIVIKPYVDDDLPTLDLAVKAVTTVDPERTFWDKVVILHGLRRWYDRRGELRGGGQRSSRHYYDIHRLLDSPVGQRALRNLALAADRVAHARMFFNRADFDLASAEPGRFALLPHDGMVDALRRDYVAMTNMIFGAPPTFDVIIESVRQLEASVNASSVGGN